MIMKELSQELSPLQIERLKYQPKLPTSLRQGINKLEMVTGADTTAAADAEQIEQLFKHLRKINHNF